MIGSYEKALNDARRFWHGDYVSVKQKLCKLENHILFSGIRKHTMHSKSQGENQKN